MQIDNQFAFGSTIKKALFQLSLLKCQLLKEKQLEHWIG